MTISIACHSTITKHMRGTFARIIIDTSTLLINCLIWGVSLGVHKNYKTYIIIVTYLLMNRKHKEILNINNKK